MSPIQLIQHGAEEHSEDNDSDDSSQESFSSSDEDSNKDFHEAIEESHDTRENELTGFPLHSTDATTINTDNEIRHGELDAASDSGENVMMH